MTDLAFWFTHHIVSLVNVSQCPSARSHPCVQTKVPIKIQAGDVPGSPVAKTLGSQCTGPRFDPWQGNQIPHASAKTQCNQINKLKKNSGNIRGVADWRAFFVQVSSSLTIDPVITDARELKMINENRDWKTTDRLLNQCLFPTALPNHVIKLLHTIQCYLLL